MSIWRQQNNDELFSIEDVGILADLITVPSILYSKAQEHLGHYIRGKVTSISSVLSIAEDGSYVIPNSVVFITYELYVDGVYVELVSETVGASNIAIALNGLGITCNIGTVQASILVVLDAYTYTKNNTSFTLKVTSTVSEIVYVVADLVTIAAPTKSQIIAGLNGANQAAKGVSSINVLGGVEISLVVNLTGQASPLYNIYVTSTSVNNIITIPLQLLEPPTGKQYIIVSAAPWPEDSLLQNVDASALDILEVDLKTIPHKFKTIINSDGTFIFKK